MLPISLKSIYNQGAWDNFWRHKNFPKRHFGAKAPLLATLATTAGAGKATTGCVDEKKYFPKKKRATEKHVTSHEKNLRKNPKTNLEGFSNVFERFHRTKSDSQTGKESVLLY